MTKALPFTAAALARTIKGIEKAGKHVIGVRADGTVLIGDNPPGLVPEMAPEKQDGIFADAAKRLASAEAKRKRKRHAS